MTGRFQSFSVLVRAAYGSEASTELPLLEAVRAEHGMTVWFDDLSGDSWFHAGRHTDASHSDRVMLYFPPD